MVFGRLTSNKKKRRQRLPEGSRFSLYIRMRPRERARRRQRIKTEEKSVKYQHFIADGI
jgi:hypothetical protein